mmetsp:Transcript_25151/g.55134  ORF Transcript_25151/g.55134 Transcript_25151/m.55134 type:complete len:432 (-) Transcript_25151:113-1408(-)
MIKYQNRGLNKFRNLFQLKGSAFPSAICFAVPCAVAAAVLKHLVNRGLLEDVIGWSSGHQFLYDNAPWNGFTSLVGFLTVFRLSQSHNRYWEACTSSWEMRAQWFDAASALVSFLRHSSADDESLNTLKNNLVRLFSLLHAAALAELREKEMMEDEEFTEGDELLFSVIDPNGLAACIELIRQHPCKVSVVFQWIQVTIVDNVKTGLLSIPPPILSRVFQQLGTGMVVFHDASKISEVPLPFPYAQACDYLLFMHWLMTPFIMQTWTSSPFWSAVFSFFMVLTFWSLNAISIRIEMPFGTDDTDLNFEDMQHDMNFHLLVLLMPSMKNPPPLKPMAPIRESNDIHHMALQLFGQCEFHRVSRRARTIVTGLSAEEIREKSTLTTVTLGANSELTADHAAETQKSLSSDETLKLGADSWMSSGSADGPFSNL